MKTLIVLLLSIALVVSSVVAQSKPAAPFILNVDYARFQYDDQSTYFEVYYAFYPQLVTLAPRGNGFRGAIALSMKLTNVSTGATTLERNDIMPIVLSDTTSATLKSTFINQMGFAVPFGTYTLSVMAIDSVLPHRRDSIKLALTFAPYPSSFSISDVELGTSIKASQDKSNHFYKNSLEVVPNPTLTFGVTANPVLFSYAEFYNAKPGVAYTVKSEIVDANNKVVKETSKNRSYSGTSSVDAGTANITSFPSGKYRLRLIVLEENVEVARAEKVFYIYNPHVAQATPSTTALRANELAGMTADELADEFRKGQYISTDQEIKMFAAITSEEGRRAFLAQFWADLEKGRQGRSPMTRAEYLQRVATANQKYKSFSREGWQTDRGRVFILYGDPDEVERVPSRQDTKPYETWRYLNIENGVEFVFVDRTGFSDYALVHSTKRGELRDESWQRYLR